MNDQEWLDILGPKDSWNEKHILALFALTGIPASLLDVGCGTGAMVNVAKRLGVNAFGVDLLKRPEKHFFKHDLREPFSLRLKGGPGAVQMVICLEVAEHIPKEFHDVFCDTIAKHTVENSMVIFSAAYPGQGGDDHEAELPSEYWREKFHHRGLTWQDYATSKLIVLWQGIKSPLFWLPANVSYYTK